MDTTTNHRATAEKAVIWPDGCMDSAPSWLALFDQVRRNQWHRYTRKQFRAEMTHRAEVWSGAHLDLATCDLETFFRRLEDAGVLRIVAGIEEVGIDGETEALS